ncbi:hypothetical protein ABE504_25145 [Paenibacillus oryzisoli]|uniref:hypothetical protein n=1 Tax=Paenibacillus oryzisoli TaxID=1850517 RepID=UPI003D2B6811
MSLVSVVARENFVTVMSDGRVQDKVGTIQEDYQKFVQLSPNLFLAFTGHAEPAEALLKAFEIQGFKNMLPEMAFEQFNFLITGLIKAFISKSPYKLLMAYGGVNEKNEVVVYYINSLDLSCDHYSPKGNDINVICLGNGHATSPLLGTYLNRTGSDTPQQILSAQRMLNDHVAELDESVNKHTFQLIIEKLEK